MKAILFHQQGDTSVLHYTDYPNRISDIMKSSFTCAPAPSIISICG